MRVKVVGTGLYAPPHVETAEALAPKVGRSAEWILSRTGVARRHIAFESMAEMAAKAGRLALGDGGPPDLVVNASLTPMQLIPDSSVFVQQELGQEGIPSFSIHATCLSFLVAAHTVAGLIEAGAYRRVLVVSSEQSSTSRDLGEPESAVLLGDGCGAAVFEPTPEGEPGELLAWRMSTWPAGASLAEFRGCGTRRHPNDPAMVPTDNMFHMNGPAIYRMGFRRVAEMLGGLMESAGLTLDEIDLVVPHQASGPALAVLPRLGFRADKVVDILAEYGNCVAASLPMALAHAHAEGRLERGDNVLLLGTGAGISVAGAVIRW